jgi:sugar lactone lactonase YvrE
MNIITFAFQVLLCVALVAAAIAAITRARWLAPLADALPSTWMGRIALAVLFSIGAVAVLAGLVVPFAVFFASCIAFVSAIVLALRLVRSKSKPAWPVPALIAIASVTVAVAQPLGLKVLLLPKAEDLPVALSRSNVVKTYDEGLWFEGIAAGNDGTLYLAGNRGIEFSRSDYYHDAQGELIARQPNGKEQVLFKTPRGTTAGVIAVAGDGTLYMTSHGDVPCIWRIDAQGNAQQVTRFSNGAWPNGLDIGPDGMLYTPDSALGVIWRVDPNTGHADVAIRDTALSARPYIALAPGANGLHFKGRDMIVTVSDKTTVLKYPMDDKGSFGKAVVLSTGIPGDDFAIGRDGALFVTTHPYNTVVRVMPDGKRTIIGKSEQHIVGATDAVFGKGEKDRETLYVVTDGGAFTGGPKTRGELIALKPYEAR